VTATDSAPATPLLVVDRQWSWYEHELRAAYPEIEVIAVPSFADAEAELDRVQILATMGVPLPGIEFTSALAERMPKLEWVQCLISGPERVRAALAARPEVLVTTVAGIHGPQMSEMALLQMIALGRGLRKILHNQDAEVWERVPQRILEGKSVGIVGMGAVGTHLARVCQAFGTRVYGFSRTLRPVEGVDQMCSREDLVKLIPELDFVVLALPADGDTRHLVDAKLLAAMKPSAYLINIGRGSVVDEDALVRALSDGTIAGAGLDVFATEPLPPTSPLWQLENVIVTPHLGGHHDQSAAQTFVVLDRNLRAFLQGKREQMLNIVPVGT